MGTRIAKKLYPNARVTTAEFLSKGDLVLPYTLDYEMEKYFKDKNGKIIPSLINKTGQYTGGGCYFIFNNSNHNDLETPCFNKSVNTTNGRKFLLLRTSVVHDEKHDEKGKVFNNIKDTEEMFISSLELDFDVKHFLSIPHNYKFFDVKHVQNEDECVKKYIKSFLKFGIINTCNGKVLLKVSFQVNGLSIAITEQINKVFPIDNIPMEEITNFGMNAKQMQKNVLSIVKPLVEMEVK